MTAEHPLFAVGAGWVTAGALAPGDAIRNADLRDLTVLAAELDPTPTRVHNLEVEGAHTYYAGELEAWGHNARSPTSGDSRSAQQGKKLHGQLCNYLGGDFQKLQLKSGKFVDAVSFTLGIVVELKPARRRNADYCQLQSYVDELREMHPDIDWTGLMMRY